MEIKLYRTNSNKNSINKILSEVGTLNGRIIEPCDVLNPKIEINTPNVDFNYIKIDNQPFNRFYFINNTEITNATHIILNCSVDVLMSFKNDILGSQVIAERSTTSYNKYVPDNYDIVTAEKRLSFTRLPFRFSTDETSGKHYILTIGGK